MQNDDIRTGTVTRPYVYKILFISLGCDKNLVDSEQMIGMLRKEGFEFTDDEMEADVIVENSCCFIKDAKQESIDTIIEMGRLKETGKLKALILTGCLAERYYEDIKKELPEVDAVIGTTGFDEIVSVVKSVLEGKGYDVRKDLNRLTYIEGEREITTGGHYDYLKIAEGCSKHCTYCIIPKIRGEYRSVPMEKLVDDAVLLAQSGVKELIIVAQETTVYGVDLYGHKALPELLRKLCRIEGIEWIRIMYCYPEEIDDELISVIKDEPKICHYLDLPVQHCSDGILKAMGRRTSKRDLVEIISRIRKEIPDIALRTTLISGFPGETEEDHAELLEFVKEVRFDRLGDFTYSKEEDTPAALLAGQIPERVKKQRRSEIMNAQQVIAFEKADQMKGTELVAFIEGYLPKDRVYIARSYRDAPVVDGYVFIKAADGKYMSGDMVVIEVTGAQEYDITGRII